MNSFEGGSCFEKLVGKTLTLPRILPSNPPPPFRWLLLNNKGDKPIWEKETVHTTSQVIWQTLGGLLEMIHQL